MSQETVASAERRPAVAAPPRPRDLQRSPAQLAPLLPAASTPSAAIRRPETTETTEMKEGVAAKSVETAAESASSGATA